jgi:hypothetical protein
LKPFGTQRKEGAMSLIRKLAPTALVAAMVGYCCWPHLSGSWRTGMAAEPGKLPEIAASLLSPAIAAAPDRDPFQSVAPEPQVAAQHEEPEQAAAPEQEPEEAAEPAERFVLNGTMLRGDRRFAVINGQLYALGEPLRVSDSAAGPHFIAAIDVDKVVIGGPGQPVELRYESLASAAGSGPAKPTAAPPSAIPPRPSQPAVRRVAPASPPKKSTHRTKTNQATP